MSFSRIANRTGRISGVSSNIYYSLKKTGTRAFFSSFFGADEKKSKEPEPESSTNINTSASTAKTTTKNTVTRNHIVQMIAEEHELTFAKADRIVKGIFDSVAESVVNKERVGISGFGTFTSYTAKPRKYFNIQSGEMMVTPARQRVKFSPAKAWKDSLNET